MADVLNLQQDLGPDTPGEEKASVKSWVFCRNSRHSNAFCFRW